MIAWQFLLLILVIAASLGPGFLVVQKLPWSLPDKFVAAIGAGLATTYLAAGLLFLSHAPQLAYFAVSVLGLACLFLSRRMLQALLAHRQVRRAVGGFVCLWLWALLLLAMIRNYSGGTWVQDWIEHYQRTLFFLDHQPKDTVFIGIYSLPARPPLMNLVTAYYLTQVGRGAELFQFVFTTLNVLIFLPAWLLVRYFVPRMWARGAGWLLAGFLVGSPLIAQNATYAWTKGLTNFYVLLGLWFYVRSYSRSGSSWIPAAFLALAAGALTHYSAVPYILFLVAHYFVAVFLKRPDRWREIGVTAGVIGSNPIVGKI